jgi:hypothetical protein
MSLGIASRGAEARGEPQPTPLPAQALDHGTGYLLAAGVCRSLTRLLVDQRANEVRLSLARTGQLLMGLGDGGRLDAPDFWAADAEPWLEEAPTAFGPVRRVRCPGRIEGVEARWTRAAGPLGVDPPTWNP